MSINFIANDPAAPGAVAQEITPISDRATNKVGLDIVGLPPEAVYPITSNDFVAWQARESAIRTLDIFETIAGPISGWRGKAGELKLALYPNAGQDLNAYYDRASVSFFVFPLKKALIYSGASTDVVAHEVGHAILDALRPDLWNVSMLEVGAFHEGFGDCMAIMTALSDADIREDILKNDPMLISANYVEATAEQLSETIAKAVSSTHNAAEPRRGRNNFKWAFPQSLPSDGKPGALINEVHSFGQLTSGCYYDLILEIFRESGGGTDGLWSACKIATRLLAAGARAAPVKPRFLDSVGRAMILADRAERTKPDGTGLNEVHIKTAFANHGIQLSSVGMLVPGAVLSTPNRRKARRAKKSSALSTSARNALRSIFNVDVDARIFTRDFALGVDAETEVTSYRQVDLSGIDDKLDHVKAYAPQVALVGNVGGSTAILGAVDPAASISSEVRDFVETLVQRKQIDFAAAAKSPKASSAGAADYLAYGERATHVVRRRGEELVLERAAFRCACHVCK